MIKYNVGALRPATDDARATRMTAANDLVQRTLAQHGLMPGTSTDQNAATLPGLPAMDTLLARLGSPVDAPSSPSVPLLDGAKFWADLYSCAAGTRAYKTYVPSTATNGVTGIVVMLHGCTQNADDFAAGTGMNALAEMHRFVVIYPQQSRGDNAQSCWNWFSRGDQRRDRGEPAILAGLTRKAMAEHGVSKDRTFVAGLSAGAAMAVVMGETYPDVFSAVGAHSGLPYGAAKDVPSAFAAMAGDVQDVTGRANGTHAMRTIVIHGTADATVHPSNGARIARQVMDRGARQTIETETKGTTFGRSFTCKITTTPDGRPELEHWIIDGLGHAWSGGQPGGTYTDAQGPDVSAEMIRFFFHTPDEDL